MKIGLIELNEREVDLNEDYGTRNKKYRTKGLLNILKSYNFTIDENTPVDEEVAFDPELLGRVFANLLVSYNPETATTARKATGSYYTPREIVDYMVKDSIKEYLSNRSILASDVFDYLNPYDEIDIHRGNLPHWQQKGVWYFVTFRLADSISQDIIEKIREECHKWLCNKSITAPEQQCNRCITAPDNDKSKNAFVTMTLSEDEKKSIIGFFLKE